jgi:REP element-mobilizing transposase RayT
VDNQVYFISARCNNRFPAFAAEAAKAVFWERTAHYMTQTMFTPWVVSLLDNHYHILGYARSGQPFKQMMQRIHGSIAKQVNDLLPVRQKPFWSDKGTAKSYFDGCIRDETQARRAYRYTLAQSVRHRVCAQWEDYPHTRVTVELEPAVRRAQELNAFMKGVPYKRYDDRKRKR